MTATRETGDRSLLSYGMLSVLAAQFFSALADNAALIIAIALVRSSGAEQRIPLLQEAFIVPFILLAPFAGPVSDGFPKGARDASRQYAETDGGDTHGGADESPSCLQPDRHRRYRVFAGKVRDPDTAGRTQPPGTGE